MVHVRVLFHKIVLFLWKRVGKSRVLGKMIVKLLEKVLEATSWGRCLEGHRMEKWIGAGALGNNRRRRRKNMYKSDGRRSGVNACRSGDHGGRY